MAKGLTFNLGGATYNASVTKIDRKKLYGWQETKAFDEEGSECALMSMDEGGTIILPKGGVGMGVLSLDGNWVERSNLKTVSLDGMELPLYKSSYDITIPLDKIVTEPEYLNHTITAAYFLNTDTRFAKTIGNNIFTFLYNYRDGYEQSTAFILQTGGSVFMLVGYYAPVEMLSLFENAEIDEEEGEEEDFDGEIDFSMM
ncbi:MAG: hypothetical protein Ta2G_09720 [Termitinemataceae bacterium]|nr:MAG: hypothetical protein Ta2G_09720 [Termitinemataceae bacterium]